MGRVFEKRKHRMFARYAKMAKGFTRIGKEIVIAVKAGGANPDNNARLRIVMQNAKSINMPKDRVEAAIKKASSKEEKDYEEMVYEGYAPHGIPIVIETATDNPTRTVANIRMHFNKGNGTLGKTGSLDFMFERKGIFKIDAGTNNLEDLELELIDYGAEDVYADDENGIIIEVPFTSFGAMQKALEEKNITVISAVLQRIPNTLAELTEEQEKEVQKLIDDIENDDDVLAVYHNMK